MQFRTAARSDVGLKRKANEDFFAIDEEAGLFVVADGLGGHVAGRVASELAVGRMLEQVRAPGPGSDSERLRAGYEAAHRAILERSAADPELQGMGTTLDTLWLQGDRLTIGHVGDSRIYLFRERQLHGLTFDHSLVNEMVFRGALSRSEARAHPYRHVITRAIGIGAAIEPDLVRMRARPGDLFVLCSDGITAQMDTEDLAQVIVSGGLDLETTVERLIDMANACGGEDNATAVLVHLLS